ncbi:hypothetical protein L596_016415 [Steinernema carpocapsae]|uniref:Uncharacterized protein n=1 Tax=Steinernema carpocapsae TaxID=34508 RepID=A0A4U5NII7_STECR|nr:hypothetical protein L596_016415 [Steinernema carpocapsae]
MASACLQCLILESWVNPDTEGAGHFELQSPAGAVAPGAPQATDRPYRPEAYTPNEFGLPSVSTVAGPIPRRANARLVERRRTWSRRDGVKPETAYGQEALINEILERPVKALREALLEWWRTVSMDGALQATDRPLQKRTLEMTSACLPCLSLIRGGSLDRSRSSLEAARKMEIGWLERRVLGDRFHRSFCPNPSSATPSLEISLYVVLTDVQTSGCLTRQDAARGHWKPIDMWRAVAWSGRHLRTIFVGFNGLISFCPRL